MKSLSNTLIAAIFAAVLTLVVAVLSLVPFFDAKESQTADELMKLRYQLQNKLSPRPLDKHLVFVAVDEYSVLPDQLGAWPFPRNVHGQLMGVLSNEHPKTVGWDIFFTEERNQKTALPSTPAPTPAPPAVTSAPDASGSPAPAQPDAPPTAPPPETEDQVLVEGAALLPSVVTAAQRDDTVLPLKADDFLPTRPFKNVTGDTKKLISADSARLPFTELRKKTFFGFADEETTGGVRRTLPLVVNIGGAILPSLDLQILLQYWGIDPDKVTVNLGHEVTFPLPDGTQMRIPIDDKGSLTINYRARIEDFESAHQYVSYSKLGVGLADKAANKTSKERDSLPAIKDNIIVIGVTINGTDAGVTPLDTNAPNVVTRLNILNNILQRDFVLSLSPWIWMPVYGLFVFGLANLMLRTGVVKMILIALVSIVVVAAASFGSLYLTNLQVPLLMPVVGLLFLAILVPSKGFFGEEREKTRIKNAMRAYLSDKIMTKVLEHPDNVKLGGVKQEITILFCDIRGFTKYCDERDPGEVLDVVNEYFEAMTQVVFKYDGTVDKYIGDCIMAFWNAPSPQADHAQRAVCCAMEMRYALANFKTKRAGLDTELFECGIGIHTGEALVGNMGSSLKVNYTAMGSTVNMAARLEALTKRLNERILISQDTLNQLQGDFPITDRGEAAVPGFAKPIHVYAIGAEQDISAALNIGKTLAGQQEYTAEEVEAPIWKPAPLPDDANPNS